MKTIVGLLSVCFVLITVCIIYLVRSGVVIRSAPYIRPTIVAVDFKNVPENVFLRLFPDLQASDYLIWGLDFTQREAQQTLSGVKELYETQFKAPVQMIMGLEQATTEALTNCAKPCWIVLGPDQAHSLKANQFIENKILPLQKEYFTITWLSFPGGKKDVPPECISEKRLDVECLKWVSIADEKKKLKQADQRYFFLRKYLDHDYFLLVQEPIL